MSRKGNCSTENGCGAYHLRPWGVRCKYTKAAKEKALTVEGKTEDDYQDFIDEILAADISLVDDKITGDSGVVSQKILDNFMDIHTKQKDEIDRLIGVLNGQAGATGGGAAIIPSPAKTSGNQTGLPVVTMTTASTSGFHQASAPLVTVTTAQTSLSTASISTPSSYGSLIGGLIPATIPFPSQYPWPPPPSMQTPYSSHPGLQASCPGGFQAPPLPSPSMASAMSAGQGSLSTLFQQLASSTSTTPTQGTLLLPEYHVQHVENGTPVSNIDYKKLSYAEFIYGALQSLTHLYLIGDRVKGDTYLNHLVFLTHHRISDHYVDAAYIKYDHMATKSVISSNANCYVVPHVYASQMCFNGSMCKHAADSGSSGSPSRSSEGKKSKKDKRRKGWPKGVCFKYNYESCEGGDKCGGDHVCRFCKGPHRGATCDKKGGEKSS